MSFVDYMRVLRASWRSIIVLTLLGAAVGAGVTETMTQRYTAFAEILFTADTGTVDGQDLALGAQYTQSRMISYKALVKTPEVLRPVIDFSDLDESPADLADQVNASFENTSTLLRIEVEDEDPRRAASLAGSVALSLNNAVAVIESRPVPTEEEPDATLSIVTGDLVTDPSTPSSPSSPNQQINIAGGTLLGALLGIGLGALRYVRRRNNPTPTPRRRLFPKKSSTPEEAPTSTPDRFPPNPPAFLRPPIGIDATDDGTDLRPHPAETPRDRSA